MNFAGFGPYLTVFLSGAAYTLLLSASSIIVGLALTALLYVLSNTRFRPVSIAIGALQEVIRLCPPLVVLLWLFYGLPGIGVALSPFAAATCALAVYFAVFGADILRAAAATIPAALLDTETTLARSRFHLLTCFTLPDLFRRTFPAMNAQVISAIKNSSLASVVGAPELTYIASLVATEFVRPFEVYTILGAAYVLTILPIVLLLRRLERATFVAMEPAKL